MTVDISRAAVEIVLNGLRTREWPQGFASPAREYWADLISALSARVEELETALRPFADAAKIADAKNAAPRSARRRDRRETMTDYHIGFLLGWQCGAMFGACAATLIARRIIRRLNEKWQDRFTR